MAGRTLDETWTDQKAGAEDVRLRGVALVVTIQYFNLKRWTFYKPEDPPWYTISVEAMQSHKYKDISVKHVKTNSRELQMAYGVYIIVKQEGSLAYFEPIYALVALTSAMALLAVSNIVIDTLMVTALPRKDEYYHAKYKESENLHAGHKETTQPVEQ
jgi:hypothetical protein